jgi:hypothetical protein
MSRAIIDTAYLIALVTVVVLKLAGVIDWSWWWVLSPVWIGLIGMIGLLVIVVSWPPRSRVRKNQDARGTLSTND